MNLNKERSIAMRLNLDNKLFWRRFPIFAPVRCQVQFTEAANILFRIGDYHQLSPHGYPLTRYRAFTDGVNGEITPGSQFGTWMMDTPETFSEVGN